MFVLDEDKKRKGTRPALSLFIRFGSGKRVSPKTQLQVYTLKRIIS